MAPAKLAAREREGRAKPKREAERGTKEWDVWERVGEGGVSGDGVSGGRSLRSKGLVKRVLWVGSRGKGSMLMD